MLRPSICSWPHPYRASLRAGGGPRGAGPSFGPRPAAAHVRRGEAAERQSGTVRIRAPRAEVRLVAARRSRARRFDKALAGIACSPTPTPARRSLALRRAARAHGTGRSGDIFQRMLRNAERMPEHYREAQHEWLALAREQVLGSQGLRPRAGSAARGRRGRRPELPRPIQPRSPSTASSRRSSTRGCCRRSAGRCRWTTGRR